MIFTQEQIESLLELIDVQTVYLVGYNLGNGSLTDADKMILEKHGIDVNSFVLEYPPFLQAYLWGRLAALLSEQQASLVTYENFIDYVRAKQWEPLTLQEKATYEVARQKTYYHIKSFGERIKSSVNDVIVEQDQATRKEQERVLSEELAAAILDRRNLQTIVSNIGRKLNDWSKDWNKIVNTELQDIYNRGKAATIEEKFGLEQRVYKDTYAGACRWCIRLHTTAGIGSEPIIFTLDELYANGSNVGLPKDQWKATVSPIHPFCRCDIRYILEGQEWDKKNKRFATVAPKNKIERKSKVKIKVGSQNFEI